MSEGLNLMLALLVGAVLGAIFFGGLWWTVLKGVSSRTPAIWFLASMLVRMGITLMGFYFVARGHWQRLLMCLLGFVIVRIVVTRLMHIPAAKQALVPKEAGHAS